MSDHDPEMRCADTAECGDVRALLAVARERVTTLEADRDFWRECAEGNARVIDGLKAAAGEARREGLDEAAGVLAELARAQIDNAAACDDFDERRFAEERSRALRKGEARVRALRDAPPPEPAAAPPMDPRPRSLAEACDGIPNVPPPGTPFTTADLGAALHRLTGDPSSVPAQQRDLPPAWKTPPATTRDLFHRLWTKAAAYVPSYDKGEWKRLEVALFGDPCAVDPRDPAPRRGIWLADDGRYYVSPLPRPFAASGDFATFEEAARALGVPLDTESNDGKE